MDRTLISWNVPNLITVPAMAALGFLLVAVVYQVGRKFMGGATGSGSSADASTAGGY